MRLGAPTSDTIVFALLLGGVLIVITGTTAGLNSMHLTAEQQGGHHSDAGHNMSDGGGGGGHYDMHGGGGMAMMPMSFSVGFDTILWFDAWHPHTPLAYFVSVVALVALALAHEALAAHRVTLAATGQVVKGSGGGAGAGGYGGGSGGSLEDPLSSGAAGGSTGAQRAALRRRTIASSLYAANLATGYLLMLAVMTFNAGYFVGVVGGMGAGHFLFASRPWHAARAASDTCCKTINSDA